MARPSSIRAGYELGRLNRLVLIYSARTDTLAVVLNLNNYIINNGS